jgi:hypothetical protein
MQTVTVDIINTQALKLLHDLDVLNLIRVHDQKTATAANTNLAMKYKGAMTRQPLSEIDNQLNDLRNGWE